MTSYEPESQHWRSAVIKDEANSVHPSCVITAAAQVPLDEYRESSKDTLRREEVP
jgi:hypothetical protein